MVINFNGNKIISRNGLVDLLNDNMNKEGLYPDHSSEGRGYRDCHYSRAAVR
ncbi:MAG: hypothetical protein MZV63_52040 [Marinilabiliales bacterium]|nr:hypothetical protein [Marinilabiliales bacterium]